MGTSERGCTDIKTSLNELIEILGAIALALLIVVLVLPKSADKIVVTLEDLLAKEVTLPWII